MAEPAQDATPGRCARCGGAFRCGMGDAAPCWCTTLRVDPGLLADAARRWAGCLCPACLAGLASARTLPQGPRGAP